MRSSLRIHEVVSGLMPDLEQRPELQDFATSLSSDVRSVLGEDAHQELLNTPANVVSQFLRVQLSSQVARCPRDSDWHQQAHLTIQHAETLSGSLAVLYGEEPAELYGQDCLTPGSVL